MIDMKWYLVIIYCAFSIGLFAQEEANVQNSKELDSLYREDQFYIGFTFNLLVNRPSGVDQSGFSGGMHLGFIRDMPINKRRNVALGVGLGYSFNTYNQGLFISEDVNTGETLFNSLDDVDFDFNRFTTHLIEMPLQFRWRTSVPETHKFYRIYTGLRMGYLFSFRSKFRSEELGVIRQSNMDALNPWRVGATFTFGWNTVNFHFYYSLNALFSKEALIGAEQVGINTAKIGLMFYIL